MSPTRKPIPAGTLIHVHKCLDSSGGKGTDLLENVGKGWAIVTRVLNEHPRYGLKWVYPKGITVGVNEFDVYDVPNEDDVPDWVWAELARIKLMGESQ